MISPETEYNVPVGYTKKAISGFSWQTVLKLLQSGLTVLKVSILARLLSPEDFGMFSLITIALGIVEAFTETGVNFTILQSKHSISYFVSTAWVIAIVRGFSIAILMVLLGMFMGSFYSEPQLPLYIGIAALVPIIKGFINPSIVSLHKKLDFFKDSAYRLSLSMIDVTIAVIFGFWLQSFMAMIVAMIGTALFEVVISFLLFETKPTFRYIHSRAKAIYSNAKWLSVSALLSYAHENVDNFILGRTIGTYQLGLYHNGYTLGHKVNYDLSKSAYHGTLPIFTKIAADRERLVRAFRKSFIATSGIALLLSLPLFFFAKPIVLLVLGENWLSIVPYVPFLTLAGLLQAVSMQVITLFMATRKFKYSNLYLAVTVGTLVPLITILSQSQGIMGAALALIISRTVGLPILIWGVLVTLKKPT